jgi:membrane-associated phospholipid phosphatase
VLNFTSMAAVVLTVTATLPQPAPPPDVNPLTNVVQNLVRDLRDFASLQTVAILGIGAVTAEVSGRSDARVDAWTLDHPAPDWTGIGRFAGDGWTQGGLALGTWVVGELADHRPTAHVGSDLMRAQMVNMVTTRVLKIVVDRERPSGGRHAFPSGHASAAFTTAGVLHRHLGWKGAIPAYAAAGFIGVTRVRDRAHWVSDTVFGAALGVSAAWSVTRGHDSRSWSVTPVALPGGGGVVVRW